MTDAITLIEAVIRDQLRSFKIAELGVVTNVYSHESSSDKNNYECDVKLRNSGLELKRVGVATQRVGSVAIPNRSEEHTSELQSQSNLVCRLLLEKKKKKTRNNIDKRSN